MPDPTLCPNCHASGAQTAQDKLSGTAPQLARLQKRMVYRQLALRALAMRSHGESDPASPRLAGGRKQDIYPGHFHAGKA